jgi:hypothetical protein
LSNNINAVTKHSTYVISDLRFQKMVTGPNFRGGLFRLFMGGVGGNFEPVTTFPS